MKKLTDEQALKLNEEFSSMLNIVLQKFRTRALSQFQYSINTNVPLGILKPGEVVDDAIITGFVGGSAAFGDFSIEPTVLLAARLLEDVNAHTEAAPLFALLKKWEEEAK